MPVEAVARRHYDAQRRLARSVAAVAARAWAQVDPDSIIASWAALSPQVSVATAGAQQAAASQADTYVADALAAQGRSADAVAQVVPGSLSGVASDGRPLDTLIGRPAGLAVRALSGGHTVPRALAAGRASLDMIVRTQVADAGRVSDQVALVAHPAASGYVRMLVPPSCSRCVVLAGRWYRYNAGFRRHPRCDCRAIPSSEDAGRDLRTDPRAFFDALSRADQDRIFTRASAEAIRLGADIAQTVNARRGTYVAGGRRLTRSSTSRRGVVPGVVRPMPEQILREATSRGEALMLLRRFGYLR